MNLPSLARLHAPPARIASPGRGEVDRTHGARDLEQPEAEHMPAAAAALA